MNNQSPDFYEINELDYLKGQLTPEEIYILRYLKKNRKKEFDGY